MNGKQLIRALVDGGKPSENEIVLEVNGKETDVFSIRVEDGKIIISNTPF